MRILIDACVLYPTVMRELVLAAAATGWCTPLWSARIVDEWRHVGDRLGTSDAEVIAATLSRWPEAMVTVAPGTEARLHLPDQNDVHVFAAAVDGGADEILTLNIRDFPTNALAAEGLIRRHPDEFLLEAWRASEDVRTGLRAVTDHAVSATGMPSRRAVLKRARLPRLGKAVEAAG